MAANKFFTLQLFLMVNCYHRHGHSSANGYLIFRVGGVGRASYRYWQVNTFQGKLVLIE